MWFGINNLGCRKFEPAKTASTVLPRLVRMRTFKVMSFSGFVLTERAHYLAAHFLTFLVRSIVLHLFIKKTLILSKFLEILGIFEQGNLDLK